MSTSGSKANAGNDAKATPRGVNKAGGTHGDAGRGFGHTSASDTESGKAGRDRDKKGRPRVNSASSKDSGQTSVKTTTSKEACIKEGKVHTRAASLGRNREKTYHGPAGDSDSPASSQSTSDLRSRSRSRSRTKSHQPKGIMKDVTLSDSGMVTPKDLQSPSPDSSSAIVDTGPKGGTAGEEPTALTDDVGNGQRIPRIARIIDPNSPLRLLILSSKIKNSAAMQHALVGNVLVAHYKYESSTLDSLLNITNQLVQQQGGRKLESIAFVVHTSSTAIYLTGKDDKSINKESVVESTILREFFTDLVKLHLNVTSPKTRLDFLACSTAQSADGPLIARELKGLLNLAVGVSKDVTGSDIPIEYTGVDAKPSFIGDLYFRVEKLRNWSAHNQQTLAGFEKIRTVGKGAYGTAVLYRKKDDDSLVILKEINLHDMNAAERQLALNEVKVLAMLDHPNIISYYDSFEEDGIVMIEMEYADGGTLSQYLAQQDKPLEEREALAMFQQVVAAIKHIHKHSILHRDLKTANIFLTKEGVVKVGDFGISKLMSTANQANTVLGTPYYISPEMCEGKAYNDKSDIWALGCILYEMACLQKTFEGSNLPALVNKIMKGQFAPVKGTYSSEFKRLIQDMLQREPEYRPSTNDLWHTRLPEIMSKYEDPVTDYEDDSGLADTNVGGRKRKTRSVLYYFEMSNMSLTPIALPSKVKIRDVAVGPDHVIVVTMERMVYTWGEGSLGQLGHGLLESRQKPQAVEALQGKSIFRACCGSGFSVFASDNGIVMTCGDGTFGCLGHGDWCSTSRPRLIEAILSVDVIAIACGPEHVVAVGSDGEVFSWGRGADGRLGLNSEDDLCLPAEVSFVDAVCARDVRCGRDGTMLITDVGSVLACGNNEYNKLGLNQRQGFLMAMKNIFNKTEVEGQKVFTMVKALARHRVLDISMGMDHSAVVVEPGHVYTLGRNSEGQLGNGNTKLQSAPIGVKLFVEKTAFRVQCGLYYCVGGTTDNDLLYWGLRYKQPPALKLDESLNSNQSEPDSLKLSSATCSQGASLGSTGSIQDVVYDNNNREGSSSREATPGINTPGPNTPGPNTPGPNMLDASKPLIQRENSSESINSENDFTSGGFRPLSSTHKRRSIRTNSSKDKEKDGRDEFELILQPTPLLRMDSSGSHSEAGDTVTLSNFYCHGENLFIEVETTAPPPKRKSRKRRHIRKRFSAGNLVGVPEGSVGMSVSSREGGDEYSSEASEYDTYGTIPAWIKEELAHSELDVNDENEADVSDEDAVGSFHPDSSMTSIQVNKELKVTSKMAPATITKPPRSVSKDSRVTAAARKPSRRMESQEVVPPSGGSIGDFPTIDPLSSSSSSETMGQNNYSHPEKIKTGMAVLKKSPIAPVRKVTAPVPYKSKVGPSQSQKPLSRIRANKQRSRGSGEVLKDEDGKIGSTKGDSHALMLELEKVRNDKRKAEERLKAMEEEHHKHQELLKEQAELASKEEEAALKKEILDLRSDLKQQSHKLQDNYQVVLSLQEQLEKVQSEQMRQSAREVQQRATSSQSVQRESRICAVQ